MMCLLLLLCVSVCSIIHLMKLFLLKLNFIIPFFFVFACSNSFFLCWMGDCVRERVYAETIALSSRYSFKILTPLAYYGPRSCYCCCCCRCFLLLFLCHIPFYESRLIKSSWIITVFISTSAKIMHFVCTHRFFSVCGKCDFSTSKVKPNGEN